MNTTSFKSIEDIQQPKPAMQAEQNHNTWHQAVNVINEYFDKEVVKPYQFSGRMKSTKHYKGNTLTPAFDYDLCWSSQIGDFNKEPADLITIYGGHARNNLALWMEMQTDIDGEVFHLYSAIYVSTPDKHEQCCNQRHLLYLNQYIMTNAVALIEQTLHHQEINKRLTLIMHQNGLSTR